MNIRQFEIKYDNTSIYYFSLDGENTIYGGLSCLQNDKFHIFDIGFKPDDVIIDIGSNIGVLSLTLAKLFPQTKVYSFDIQPISIKLLKMGIIQNGLINVTAFDSGVSNETKDVICCSNETDITCSVESTLAPDSHINKYNARVISIADIFDSPVLNIKKVKYLKMDIEGAEYTIFDFLFEKRPDILDRIEFLHLEIHGSKEKCDPLKEKVKKIFGNKVFFDT
jgi:FkbM family methyltransferase